MSKAFEQFLEQSKKDGLTLYPGPLHNAAYVAWNAALEHAAEICEAQLIGVGKYDHPVDISYDRAVTDCAEAIRKEKTE